MTENKPPAETRGGESPDDWNIAEEARRAAAAFEALSRAFREQEILAQGEE